MKITHFKNMKKVLLLSVTFFTSGLLMGQDTTRTSTDSGRAQKTGTNNRANQKMGNSKGTRSADDNKLMADSRASKAAFITSDANMQALFEKAYACVIFPNVGKGAVGIGGAAGNGIAFQGGEPVGRAKMKQVSVGFQFGGQAYREVIFFENQAAFEEFTRGDYEIAGQVSAVAVTKGASVNVSFKNGIMVFTQEKKGAMYEAAVAGQKFSYQSFGS